MKKPFFLILFATSLAGRTMLADDAAGLSGKWSLQRTNDQGQSFTQTVEIKSDKFVFEIIGSDGEPALHAEGDVKFEKMGPFNGVRFLNIRAGRSAADLQEVNDEYASVYVLSGDTWLMASNFDKDRQNRRPTLDSY